jgi:hypothetical protein
MMNWIFTWVITSPKYVPMGIASAGSFHYFHPLSQLVWLVSEEVEREFLRLVPDWLAGKIRCHSLVGAGEDSVHASRRLRLSVTEHVSGDIAAVDADILCMGKIDLTPKDIPIIGACPNRDNDGHWNNDPEMKASRELYASAGWEWPCSETRPYLNAGLVFYRDRLESREFGRTWKKNRDEFFTRTGKYFDQPAFNKSAAETGWVKVLDEKLNAPVNVLPRSAKGAICYHYYVSGGEDSLFRTTALGYLANKLATTGSLDRNEMKEIFDKKQPFVGWGAQEQQYWLAGQWRNYAERKLRVGWDHLRKKLKS